MNPKEHGFWRSLPHAFKPLPVQAKAAIVVLFAWMVLLTAGLTVTLTKVISTQENVISVQHQHYTEQQQTAKTTHEACERSKVFGPPFLVHIERVEARLHTHALLEPDGQEVKAEYPPGSGKKVGVLAFYRTTVPSNCATP